MIFLFFFIHSHANSFDYFKFALKLHRVFQNFFVNLFLLSLNCVCFLLPINSIVVGFNASTACVVFMKSQKNFCWFLFRLQKHAYKQKYCGDRGQRIKRIISILQFFLPFSIIFSPKTIF